MPRLMLTDELWSKLKAILLEDRVYNKYEHRQTMAGILIVYVSAVRGVIYHHVLACGIPFTSALSSGQGKGF